MATSFPSSEEAEFKGSLQNYFELVQNPAYKDIMESLQARQTALQKHYRRYAAVGDMQNSALLAGREEEIEFILNFADTAIESLEQKEDEENG